MLSPQGSALRPRELLTLEELALRAVVAHRHLLGDCGDMPFHLLEPVLELLSAEQLLAVEAETRAGCCARDLSEDTGPLWRRLYLARWPLGGGPLGGGRPPDPDDFTRQCREAAERAAASSEPFAWRGAYEARAQHEKERLVTSGLHLRRGFKAADEGVRRLQVVAADERRRAATRSAPAALRPPPPSSKQRLLSKLGLQAPRRRSLPPTSLSPPPAGPTSAARQAHPHRVEVDRSRRSSTGTFGAAYREGLLAQGARGRKSPVEGLQGRGRQEPRPASAGERRREALKRVASRGEEAGRALRKRNRGTHEPEEAPTRRVSFSSSYGGAAPSCAPLNDAELGGAGQRGGSAAPLRLVAQDIDWGDAPASTGGGKGGSALNGGGKDGSALTNGDRTRSGGSSQVVKAEGQRCSPEEALGALDREGGQLVPCELEL